MENSTEAGEISAHASAEEFLMIMIHYSWITLLVLFMLGACSYYSYKKQPTGRRTTQVGTEIRVRHSPGVLAHGGYPFIVRGVIGTTFFMLAILPLFLIICSTIIGLILAVVEGWEAGIGVEYLLSNVLGMSSPLTSVVPEDTFGIHFAIIMNMYAVIMVTTAMGLVANMSLMAAITEKVPQSASGFFGFLFVVVPLGMFVVTGIIGCIMAAFEGWSVETGYFFMAASMASLANPVTSAEPETAFGGFFECICLAVELSLGGCVLGLVASHPVTMQLCNWLEGTSRPAASSTDLAGYSVAELVARLDRSSTLLAGQKVPSADSADLENEVGKLRAQLEQDDAQNHINHITGNIFHLEDKIRNIVKDNGGDQQDELEGLRAKVKALEELVAKHQLEVRVL